jgi:aryl-alcohol dehydrogenase
MKIEAMVVWQPGGPFRREILEIDAPRDREVLVRIVAAGICHTDLAVVDQTFPFPLPYVLGHEGSGIVERVGPHVTGVAAGDHVVLTFNSCGACRPCEAGHPAYCDSFAALNFSGRRLDGSTTLRCGEEAVHGSFFSQSSFATHALADERSVVVVPKDAPLELLGPLGCGVQTGAGAILNMLQPWQGSTAAIFGTGAVGLSAIMAAKIAGCGRIFAADPVQSRLDLARELGATDVVDVTQQDAKAAILDAGGADVSLDTSGSPSGVTAAIGCLKRNGSCGLVSSGKRGSTVTLPIAQFTGGRRIFGVIEGDSSPGTFIPALVELHRQGKLPFERMVKFYDFSELNPAAADALSGSAIKPIIRMSR